MERESRRGSGLLDEQALQALRDVVLALVRQDGRGVPRRALLGLTDAAPGYALSVYAESEPVLAVAQPSRVRVSRPSSRL